MAGAVVHPCGLCEPRSRAPGQLDHPRVRLVSKRRTTDEGQAGDTDRPHIAMLFLRRLVHLLDLERRTPTTRLNERALIHAAQVSTYKDCVALGYRDEAHILLVPWQGREVKYRR